MVFLKDTSVFFGGCYGVVGDCLVVAGRLL